MDNSKNRKNEYLGINKVGKNIRKSPMHQPNFANNAANGKQTPPAPQPQVYNISKNDFRDIVQQLTGSPAQERAPAQNSPKPQSMRLQKIRPPPLAGVNRPHIPPPMPVHAAPPPHPQTGMLPRPAQFGQPLTPPGNLAYADSPVSAYMRYLQHSMLNPSPLASQPPPQQPQPQPQPQPQQQAYGHPQAQAQMQPQSHPQPQVPNNVQGQPPSSGLLPNPAFPTPSMSGPGNPYNGAFQPVPSPQMIGPSFWPSPTSQFLLPSPNGYTNLLSPRSPYPLLSPGVMFPPLTPNFAFSPTAQSGILGPGPHPPPSPGLSFPLSPSGFFPIPSPRWRDY